MWSKTAVVCASSEASSSLQLAFDLVQKAPIGAVGDNLLRARLDEAHFLQPQCVEPDSIFGIVFAPFVGIFFQGLQQKVIPVSETAIGDVLRDTLGFAVAEIRCLQDGADRALGGNRVLVNEFPIADQHAAEILRPRTVQGRIDNDVTGGVASAVFLRVGRETEK